MSFISKLVGGGVKEAAEGVANAINMFVETPDEKRAAETLLAKMQQEPDKWQAQINKTEAAHRTLFVAGWRPSIGWVCSVSLGVFYIPQFTMAAILWAKICWNAQEIVQYPVSADGIMELVLAMLGMGSLRMIEKMSGKAK